MPYFMEMGTGKSKVLIDNISMLYDKGKINGLLIIAPKGVYIWYDVRNTRSYVTYIKKEKNCYGLYYKTKKTRRKKISTLFETGLELHILIMNVEAFSTKKRC